MCGNNATPSLSLDAFFSRVKHLLVKNVVFLFSFSLDYKYSQNHRLNSLFFLRLFGKFNNKELDCYACVRKAISFLFVDTEILFEALKIPLKID